MSASDTLESAWANEGVPANPMKWLHERSLLPLPICYLALAAIAFVPLDIIATSRRHLEVSRNCSGCNGL